MDENQDFASIAKRWCLEREEFIACFRRGELDAAAGHAEAALNLAPGKFHRSISLMEVALLNEVEGDIHGCEQLLREAFALVADHKNGKLQQMASLMTVPMLPMLRQALSALAQRETESPTMVGSRTTEFGLVPIFRFMALHARRAGAREEANEWESMAKDIESATIGPAGLYMQ